MALSDSNETVHANLVVFSRPDYATKWIKENRALLVTYSVSVQVVANPTNKHPEGCSILFRP